MKTALKIAGGLLAVIIALMIIVPIALSGKIGDIVKKEANEMVTATVDFSKLDISLFRHFPKASLDLEDFSVTCHGGFEGDTLVAANRISVVVDLFSIFGESFEVSKIILDAPEINARVLADGKANWDIMKPSGEAEQPAEEDAAEESGESSFKLSVTDFRIEKAKIFFTDEAAKMHFHVAPLDVALKGDLSAEQTTIRTEVAAGDITFVSDGTTLAKGIEATLKAAVAADLRNNRFTLSDNLLSVNSVKARLDGWVQLAGDDIDTDITLDCSDNDFKNILSLVPAFYTKDFKNLTAAGEVSLKAWVRGRMTAKSYPAFALDLAVKNGSFKYADLPKSVTDINLTLGVKNAGGSLDATTVDVPRFGASFGGQTFGATLSVATPISDLAFKASANGKVNLGAIKEIYPLDEGMSLNGIVTANVSAAGRMSQIEKQEFDKMQTSGSIGVENMAVTLASLPPITIDSASANITPKSASLDRLNVKVGASDIAAKGSLTNYWGYILHDTTLAGRLTVTSSLIDANELMAAMTSDETAEEKSAEEQPAEAESAAEAAPAGVIEVPKNLDLTLDSTFGKVLFEKMVIENLKGVITVKNGAMTLDKLAMDLFNGKASAYAQYSTANAKSPKVSLDASFTEASFKTTFQQLELMQQIAPIFENIDGTYTMKLAAAMSLDGEMNPVLKSVNGSGQIKSGNLKLGNIKALAALSKALGDNKIADLQHTEPTLVSFTIKDGNLITKPFDIKIGGVKLTLSGTTGLDRSIDYAATVALPENLTAYAKIGGTFSSPKITLDTKKTVEQALANVGITKESVNAGLQKQADALIAEAEKAGEKLVDAAKAERQKLIDKASNKIAKFAAEKAGDKLVSEAEKQSAKLVEEARKKADELQNKNK